MAAKKCDHKFVDSKVCLKCGWRPFCGDIKYAHVGCCEPDPNHALDRCTPATTEQKAAAGKGGAVEE